MKVSLAFFALLLGCSCSSGYEPDLYEEKKTQITDLNDDVLYLILNRLELKILLNVVKVNSKFSNIANAVVRRKYQNYKIEISVPTSSTSRISLYEVKNQIKIYNISWALNMLKYFGNSFRSLKIEENNMDSIDLSNVYQFVDKYCSKSLKQLQLGLSEHASLDKFMMPFEAIEELHIQVMQNVQIVNNTKPLKEIFPNLRKLTLFSFHGVNFSFINSELSHLEHFRIDGSDRHGINVKNKENIRQLIRKNPKIRNIELYISDLSLVTLISQHLPNLENLSLSALSDGNETVRLENVKNVILEQAYVGSIDKLLMPRLDSLKIKYNSKDFNKWKEFFRNHIQLRRLHLTETHYIFNEMPVQVDVLTADLINLDDVIFKVFDYMGIRPIIQFIENHKKLNKFQFAMSNFPATNQATVLRDRFGNDWNIADIQMDFKGLSFQRKHLIVE